MYDALNTSQRAKLSTARGDLKLLILAGQAILRGKANAIEENAMAKVCNPGKTASTDKADRGFLAFGPTLDRFCNLLKIADTEELHNSFEHSTAAAVPRDALIGARLRPEMIGNSALQNDYILASQARSVWLSLKDKYKDSPDALTSPGTLTLQNKPRKSKRERNNEAIEMAALMAQHAGNPTALGEAIIAYHTAKEAKAAQAQAAENQEMQSNALAARGA